MLRTSRRSRCTLTAARGAVLFPACDMWWGRSEGRQGRTGRAVSRLACEPVRLRLQDA